MTHTIKKKIKKICKEASRVMIHISYVVTVFKSFLRGQQVKVKALSLISYTNFISHLTYLTHSFFLCTIKQFDWVLFRVPPCPNFPWFWILKKEIYLYYTLSLI